MRLPQRFGILRSRNFYLFYMGYVSSLLGTGMSLVAIAWAVMESGAGASGLGVVMAAGVIPRIVLMAFGGAVADRYGRRRVMLGADVVRTLSQASLAAALLLPVPFAGHPPLWLFAALVAIRGVGQSFFAPALSALTVEIAPRDRLADANAMYSIARSTATICGPALGGLLIALTKPGLVIAIDAATFALSVLMLSLLKIPEVSTSPDADRDTDSVEVRATIWQDIREGWQESRSRSWLCIVTVQFAFFNLITWSPWMILGPVAARQYLGGAAPWGWIMAAEGAGSIIAGVLVIGRRLRRPLMFAALGTFCFALPDVPMALHAQVPWVASAAFISGAGDTVYSVYFSSVMQQNIPHDKLARVNGFSVVPALGIGVIGYLIDGPLASAFGSTAVFATGALYGIISSMIIVGLPAIRSVTWKSESDLAVAGDDAPIEAVPEESATTADS
jgi:MFS family permease